MSDAFGTNGARRASGAHPGHRCGVDRRYGGAYSGGRPQKAGSTPRRGEADMDSRPDATVATTFEPAIAATWSRICNRLVRGGGADVV